MRYEIECGHCGYRFTQEEHELARTMKCEVCGGVLTVAIPVPVAHEEPLPLDDELLLLDDPLPLPPPEPIIRRRPRRPSPPSAFPALPPLRLPDPLDRTPSRPESVDMDTERRAFYLAPPWPGIWWGLALARNAAVLALAFYVVALGCEFFLPLLLPLNDMDVPGNVFLAAVGLQLVPALMHLRGQIACNAAPPSYGGRLSATSTWVLLLLTLLAVMLRDRSAREVVAAGCGMVVVFSAGFWLAFLSRLGQRLADRELKDVVGRYAVWFWVGVVVAVVLLGSSVLAVRADYGGLAWILKAAAAVCGVLLLLGYRFVLDAAVQAVARRAPVVTAPGR